MIARALPILMLVVLVLTTCTDETYEPVVLEPIQNPFYRGDTSDILNPPEIDYEPELWLSDHIQPISSIDVNADDFSDLHAWGEVVGDKRIVMLGEQSHGDGAAFIAKARLIRYLHEYHGFNVLAFESSIYDCWKADEILISGASGTLALRKGIYSIWCFSSQLSPLMEYLGESQNDDQRLQLAGFDVKFSGLGWMRTFVDDLKDFLQRNNIDFQSIEHWDIFESYIKIAEKLEDQREGNGITHDGVAQFRLACQTLLEEIIALGASTEVQVYRKTLNDFLNYYTLLWDPGYNPNLLSTLRDELMAEHMIWLAEEVYPNEKVIVWAATYHIMRNVEGLLYPILPISDIGGKVMGDYLFEHFGQDIYALGFSSSHGRYGGWFEEYDHPVPDVRLNSMEDFLDRVSGEYSLADFSAVTPKPEWLIGKIFSSQVGFRYYYGEWGSNLDGVFYIRTMYPSTIINSGGSTTRITQP